VIEYGGCFPDPGLPGCYQWSTKSYLAARNTSLTGQGKHIYVPTAFLKSTLEDGSLNIDITSEY
jgi:hypothetical protein